MNASLIAIASGLSGMIGWGCADFFAKKTIDEVGDMATLTWAHICGVALMFVLLLGSLLTGHHHQLVPAKTSDLLGLVFFGALQAVVYAAVYKGFAKGKLALLNPVFSSYSGLVVILSVIFFKEVIGLSQTVFLVIVFAGIVTLSLDHESFALKKVRINKLPGLKEVAFGAICAALWTVLWGNFVNGKDWLLYAAYMYAFMTVTILLIDVVQKVNLKITNQSVWKYFFMIGVAEVVAYVGISIGYSLTTDTSIIAVLSAAFSVPTLILAYIFLGERLTNFQKIGAFMVVVGVSVLPLL